MGHGVGVPAFGRIATEATQRICSPSLPARPTVHHLAQQLAFAGLALPTASAFARGPFALELLDLRPGRVAEALVPGIAEFDLARVDQQCPGGRGRRAPCSS